LRAFESISEDRTLEGSGLSPNLTDQGVTPETSPAVPGSPAFDHRLTREYDRADTGIMENHRDSLIDTESEQDRRARRDRREEQVSIFVDLRVGDRREPSLGERLRLLWSRITTGSDHTHEKT
jgi:hypothetical protein